MMNSAKVVGVIGYTHSLCGYSGVKDCVQLCNQLRGSGNRLQTILKSVILVTGSGIRLKREKVPVQAQPDSPPTWGVDSSSSTSKRRLKVLGTHMEFLASALDGKISLGCDSAAWRAYVSGFVSLMVDCTPNWVLEVDMHVLKRLSNGLRQLNEEELALALLAVRGIGTMGAATELIIDTGI
ncbi:hypothetical protein LR48_Vigan07g252200 [Vigna angularis]|uniref:Uncharacterized protein n=1 Tax=Phaseolus angularis TaxID=3914 RepID=A0A0L9V1A3_PHAAN|nr:hypothetical protein LR48_Vigan07g252200 [Vigna angularis]